MKLKREKYLIPEEILQLRPMLRWHVDARVGQWFRPVHPPDSTKRMSFGMKKNVTWDRGFTEPATM